MLFFALIGSATLLAAVAGRLGIAALRDWPARMRVGMAAALLLIGVDHFATVDRYLAMMPGFVPWPRAVVLLTGSCEIAGALGLLVPQLRRLAGPMLALYFVCVFPANVQNALAGGGIEGLPAASWYYWVRLLFQPLAIWWALYAAEAIRWPFERAVTLSRSRPAGSGP